MILEINNKNETVNTIELIYHYFLSNDKTEQNNFWKENFNPLSYHE